MLKRAFILFVFFVIVCVAAFFWVLNSSFATERILALVLKRNLHGCTLESLTIGQQRFVYPKQLFISDVRINIKLKDDTFKIGIKSVQINGLQRLIMTPVVLQVYGEGLSLESSHIKMPSADLKAAILFRSGSMLRWEGDLSIKEMEAYKYKIQNIISDMVGGLHSVSFVNLIANFYRGKVYGTINVDWTKGTHYRTDVKFDGVDINALKDVDASVYGQVEGVIQGSVSIGGTTRNFDTLGLKASVTKDGRLNASLLKFVLPYIPRTEESQKLKNLMKQGLKVPVEVATVDIRSIDEHKLSGAINLGIGQINLNLNLPVDILYDGNLFSLIEWYRKLSE